MNTGRFALLVTCMVVAGLGTWFALSRWDDANRIATVASALATVAAVGVAVWTALRLPAPKKSVTVEGTGKRAVSGLAGKADSVTVERTGDGDAISGLDLD